MKAPWYHRILYHILTRKAWNRYCARLYEKDQKLRNREKTDREKMRALVQESPLRKFHETGRDVRVGSFVYTIPDAGPVPEAQRFPESAFDWRSVKRPHKPPCSCGECSSWFLSRTPPPNPTKAEKR